MSAKKEQPKVQEVIDSSTYFADLAEEMRKREEINKVRQNRIYNHQLGKKPNSGR